MSLSAQKIYEWEFRKLLFTTARLTDETNLVFMGGCV